MGVLISVLVVFQLALILLPTLSLRWLVYSILLFICVCCLCEFIVIAQVPIENVPIRLDMLLLAPFIISFILFVVLSFMSISLPNHLGCVPFKILLAMSECVVTIVTAVLF